MTMNKLNKFAAQQLSKSQMNKVMGGWSCYVITAYTDGDGPHDGYWIEVAGSNAHEAADNVDRPDGAIQINC